MNHSAPNLEVLWIFDLEDWIIRVGRTQFNVAVFPMCQVKELHREATVPPCHDDGTVMWLPCQ